MYEKIYFCRDVTVGIDTMSYPYVRKNTMNFVDNKEKLPFF